MNEKQVTIITIVCLVLILLLGGGGIYYLQFDWLVEEKANLDAVKKQVDDATVKQKKIPKLKIDIAALKEKEKEMSSHIPNMDRQEYDLFAELLDELRRKSGVTVARATWATPSRPTPVPGRPPRNQPPTIHKVQYDMNVGGSFYQVLRYVNLIEQQSRFIGVESFSISKTGGETPAPGTRSAPPKRDLKVTIYSYTYKPLNPAPFEIQGEALQAGKSTEIPD